MPPAIDALLFLQALSLKNWLLARLKRLRQPKYLMMGIIGASYLYFVFFRRFGGGNAANASMNSPGSVLLIVVCGIAVIRVLASWLAPEAKPALAFTETEVAFLFPAPVERRTLIHYKLLGTQLAILATAVVMSLLQRRVAFVSGNAAFRAIGWWVMLSTINLHAMGASFTVARLEEGGMGRLKRRLIVGGVMAAVAAVVAAGIWQVAQALGSDTGEALSGATSTQERTAALSAALEHVKELSSTGLAAWLLLPVRLVAGPFLASSWLEFLRALVPALIVLAAHYFWVMRSEVSFEEASIAMAEKRTKALAAMRSGNMRRGFGKQKAQRETFRLAAGGGRPEIAFLWKNLISTRPYLNHRVFLWCAGIVVVGGSLMTHGTPPYRAAMGVVSFVALIASAYILLFGPQFARQDFRSDLPNADLLKTYPLAGWQVALGELLAPTAILTGIVWLTILTATIGLAGMPGGPGNLTAGFRATLAGCAALLVPLVCMLQLIVPNAGAVIFPSWSATGRPRNAGIEMVGQRIMFVAGQAIIMLVALAPVAACGTLLWFAASLVLGNIASTFVATAGIAVALVLEIALGLWWLGGRFEKLDISSEQLK